MSKQRAAYLKKWSTDAAINKAEARSIAIEERMLAGLNNLQIIMLSRIKELENQIYVMRLDVESQQQRQMRWW